MQLHASIDVHACHPQLETRLHGVGCQSTFVYDHAPADLALRGKGGAESKHVRKLLDHKPHLHLHLCNKAGQLAVRHIWDAEQAVKYAAQEVCVCVCLC